MLFWEEGEGWEVGRSVLWGVVLFKLIVSVRAFFKYM